MSSNGNEVWRFDPVRVAELEVAGWRAYYRRAWGRLLRLLLQVTCEQFGLALPWALQGSYYVVRASVAWVQVDHDLRLVRRYLRRYYTLVARHGHGLRFEPRRVADLELRYWALNRRFASEPYGEKSPLIRSLAELHAAMFGISVEEAMSSGMGRAKALHRVGKITAGRSTDLDTDWEQAERDLRSGYASLIPDAEG